MRAIGVLGAALLAAAVAAPAWALVTVRVEPEATVKGEEMTLGDLAAMSGDPELARRLKQVRLGPSPAPGGTQRIDPDYLRIRLAEPRLSPAEVHLLLPDQIVVTRAFQVLTGAAIVEAAGRQLQERLEMAGTSDEPFAVTALSRPADLRIPTGNFEVVAQVPGDPPTHGAVPTTVTVKVDGRSYQTLPLTFRVGRLRPVVVAARPIDAKSPLGPADWRIERRASTELPAGAMTAPPEAGDFEAAQAVREGDVLTPVHLRKRIAVKRGELVTLVVEGPNFRITTQGVAVTDGRKGDTLRVLNPTSKREALGIVEASGVVRVPFASAGGDIR